MREEEGRLHGEIARLQLELRAVEKARVGLMRGCGGAAVGRLRAPRGYLPRRILAVVGKASEALPRAEIIEGLRAEGYEYTLAPEAITRELVALTRAGKLKRIGSDNAARYEAVSRVGLIRSCAQT
ncbi:hypothetical protein AXK12_00795 [Cephaloticoccus capnophilus]|uniref:Uncharacterized protein n=1 Tax=Cephaloticoccus capnophilus TaxID=1548208 RepID=A0A139STU6_9BACT|nr:hypothetical protein AXK12_00795 [Cephaloticoccus capnophilus]